VKPGDLVEILEPTMGYLLSSGVRGIIIKKTHHSTTAADETWQVFSNGKVKEITRRMLNKIK
jgi:hypothetical protein